MTSLAASTRISRSSGSRGPERRVGKKPGKTGPSPQQYSLYMKFEDTGESFEIPRCCAQTPIGELKDALEMVAGIPSTLQRLSYLDEGDVGSREIHHGEDTRFDVLPSGHRTGTGLAPDWHGLFARFHVNSSRMRGGLLPAPRMQGNSRRIDCTGDLPNSSTVCFNDIVPGGVITLRVWHYDGWLRLVKAAVEGDVEKLKALGVTAADSSFSTPNSSRMSAVQRAAWVSRRASCALYISAHRGHHRAVCFLLQHGADVRFKTPLGLTALHVAAAWGHSQCVDELLKHGADIFSEDQQGATAMDYAARHGQKTSVRQLHMFKWKLRSCAGKTKSLPDTEECSENQKILCTFPKKHFGKPKSIPA
ncbi:ANR60 protein, partial [Polyodon spathula]|nr:ANR60 protein [Polyodon spathula]